MNGPSVALWTLLAMSACGAPSAPIPSSVVEAKNVFSQLGPLALDFNANDMTLTQLRALFRSDGTRGLGQRNARGQPEIYYDWLGVVDATFLGGDAAAADALPSAHPANVSFKPLWRNKPPAFAVRETLFWPSIVVNGVELGESEQRVRASVQCNSSSNPVSGTSTCEFGYRWGDIHVLFGSEGDQNGKVISIVVRDTVRYRYQVQYPQFRSR